MTARIRAGLAGLALLLLAGCRQDMHDQPKYEPLEESAIFADRAASRVPVPGTVPRGELRADTRLYAGKEADGKFTSTIPVPITRQRLERGRSRYEAFCAPCHGRTGDGQGMIVRRGFKRPTSFHDPRLREAVPGYLFDVISIGFGEMSSYAAQLRPEDRWAVVAYVRALQLSQAAPAERLGAEDLRRLEEPPETAPAAAVEGHAG